MEKLYTFKDFVDENNGFTFEYEQYCNSLCCDSLRFYKTKTGKAYRKDYKKKFLKSRIINRIIKELK